jgi:hypothetical protein
VADSTKFEKQKTTFSDGVKNLFLIFHKKLHDGKYLRTEVKGDFNTHGTKNQIFMML